MPSPVDITLPHDNNGNPIDVLPHDFSQVAHGLITLAGTCVGLCHSALYRLVATSEIFFRYGGASTAALTNPPNCAWLPANQVEYLWLKQGQTTLSVASRYVTAGCFNVTRLR